MTELHKASDKINNLRESNRASPFFNHLSAVAEGTVILGWFFESKPATFVNDMVAGIEYYGNKVLKEYKEKYALSDLPVCVSIPVADNTSGILRTSNIYRLTIASSSLWRRISANTTRKA